MDFNLKQWRIESEQEDDEDPPSSANLLFNSHQQHHPPSALPLFGSEPNTNLSATKFTRMGSYFSLSQWQELELQALIFRHFIAGADVPPELLYLVKKSLISSPYNYALHHHFPHYQPALVQSGYWGRAAMDPEPGRCRRTDGKKWRCSRDVVTGQKYCERHMHRGRNRSRKPVELHTSTTLPYGNAASGGAALKTNHSVASQVASGSGGSPHFTLSVPSHSTDLPHLNQSDAYKPTGSVNDVKGQFEAQDDGPGRTLWHFFDDWPKPVQEAGDGADSMASATNLSISMPGNSSSDFSLKLGTSNGNGDGPSAAQVSNSERERPQSNWETFWDANPVAPMGGPLAEALRSSSTTTSSPTSVLHQLPRS